MRKLSSAGIVVFVLLAAGATSADERSGEQIYETTCASCHGSDGRGAPASRTGLSIQPRDFTDCRRTNREPDHDWHAVVALGGPARGFHRLMPAFGEVLSEPEQDIIVEYVRAFCVDPIFPRGDLNLPRALVTEKAFVEDELVLSSAVATDSPRNIDAQLIYEQRFLRRQMFEVRIPVSLAKTPNDGREIGLGDVAFALKSMLVANQRTGTGFSLGAEVVLPTGNQDKEFGKGVVIFEPFAAFGQALPWDSFVQVQTGAELPAKEVANVEKEGFLRGVLGTTFINGKYGRAFTPMVEAIAFRELTSGASTSLDLVPEIQISLSRRQHVLACLGARLPTLNRADRGPQVMAYILWDWFDGKLLQGW
jgi:hypothetical protein